MMKSVYAKLEDIPAGDRQHYSQTPEGTYKLDFDDEHPTVVQNKTLQREKSTAQGTATRLTNENEELKKNQLPAGQRAVPEADFNELGQYRQLGPVQDVTKIVKEEVPVLRTKVLEVEGERQRRAVAAVMGWNPEAFANVPAQLLPELEIRDLTENGQVVKGDDGQPKKTVIAKIKGEGGAVTEKSFRDHFDSTPALKFYEPLLAAEAQQQPGVVPFPAQLPTGGGGANTDLAGALIKDRYGDTP